MLDGLLAQPLERLRLRAIWSRRGYLIRPSAPRTAPTGQSGRSATRKRSC